MFSALQLITISKISTEKCVPFVKELCKVMLFDILIESSKDFDFRHKA